MSLVVSPVNASHELAFARNLACSRTRNDVLMNLNASAEVNARSGTEDERGMTLGARLARTEGRRLPRRFSSRKACSVTGDAVVMHDASFTVELRGGPSRGAKAICRPLYCRIVHTGAELCRPG